MPMLMTYNQQQAHAAYSKVLSAAAKKGVKELATNAAVEMAEHIAFEMLMNEFINGPPPTEQGFEPVCLDGTTKSYDDCAPDKRAQVKKNLTVNDKQNLANKVEQVIEKKTNTDSRMAKFLDFFIPLFLISGVASWIQTQLDGDDQSLIDDIANEALKDAGLVKTLAQPYEIVDYVPYFKSAKVITTECFFDKSCPTLELVPSKELTFTTGTYNTSVSKPYPIKGTHDYLMMPNTTYTISVDSTAGYTNDYQKPIIASFGVAIIEIKKEGVKTYQLQHSSFRVEKVVGSVNDAVDLYKKMLSDYKLSLYDNLSLNNSINNFFKQLQPWNEVMHFNITPTTVPAGDIDISHLKPTDKTKYKNGDGTFNIAGQSSVPIKTPDGTRVYPNDDGTEWSTLQGDKVEVDEDTLTVGDVTGSETETPPTDPEEPPKEEPYPKCEKDLDKIEFKKVGTAFTYAFPFSIPWDVKRYIDAAFGGVGSERPSFALFGFFGDARIELPAYFDNWMPFLHGALVLMFDVSLIYLFYRFMGRGGD